MSEQNKAVVRRFIDGWINEHDPAAFRESTAADVVFHWGAMGEGESAEEMRTKEEEARAAFPDLEATSAGTLAEGNLVMERYTITGTHRGRWFGAEATGTRAEWTAVATYRIENGQIAEMWLNEDWAGVLQQVGALPPHA